MPACWSFRLVSIVVHRFDIVDAVLYDPRMDREYLQFAALLLGIAVITAIFCAIVLDKMFGIDYEKKVPWAVPLATLCGLVGYILLWMAVWPVWRFMTIIIMPVLFMGFLVSLIFLPI